MLFSHSVMSASLWPNGLQHARLPCPSLSPGVSSHLCSLSWWCHIISPFFKWGNWWSKRWSSLSKDQSWWRTGWAGHAYPHVWLQNPVQCPWSTYSTLDTIGSLSPTNGTKLKGSARELGQIEQVSWRKNGVASEVRGVPGRSNGFRSLGPEIPKRLQSILSQMECSCRVRTCSCSCSVWGWPWPPVKEFEHSVILVQKIM